MTQVVAGTHEFYMDGYMKSNLDIILKEAIPAKWDCVSIYTGREGVGKTTKVSQDAIYMDPKMTLETMVFNPHQLIEAINTAPNEASIILDEAITVANAQAHADRIVITIISMLTQIRKKRLKIFLCFPYLNMLNKFFIQRSLYSCHITAKSFNNRGYFDFYSQPRTAKLHYMMKTVYPYDPNQAYNSIFQNFYGRFTKYFPFDETEYDTKKEWSRKNWEKQSMLWRERFIVALQMIKKDTDLPIARVAAEIGLKRQTLYELMKNAVENKGKISA